MIVEFIKSQDFLNTSGYPLFDNSNVLGFQNIQGVTRLKLESGKAIFSPEKFFADPNAEVFLQVTNPNILRYYHEFFSGNETFADYNLNGKYAFIFSIKLRECIVGEIFLSQINRLISNSMRFLNIFPVVTNVLLGNTV